MSSHAIISGWRVLACFGRPASASQPSSRWVASAREQTACALATPKRRVWAPAGLRRGSRRPAACRQLRAAISATGSTGSGRCGSGRAAWRGRRPRTSVESRGMSTLWVAAQNVARRAPRWENYATAIPGRRRCWGCHAEAKSRRRAALGSVPMRNGLVAAARCPCASARTACSLS